MSKVGDQIRMFMKLKGFSPLCDEGTLLPCGSDSNRTKRFDLGPIELVSVSYSWPYMREVYELFGLEEDYEKMHDMIFTHDDFYKEYLPERLPSNVIFLDWSTDHRDYRDKYLLVIFEKEDASKQSVNN